jgi:hypothetical protein
MSITTEEAERLAQTHDLVRFTLGMKAPEHDLTAAAIRSLAAERDALKAEVKKLRAKADSIYSERNRLAVAFARMALAAGFKAGTGVDPDETKWPVIYVETPNGQVSWHIAESDAAVLDGLPNYDGQWDGTYRAREADWCVWDHSNSLLSENEKLRAALRPFIYTGNVKVGFRIGQNPPPITASDEEAWKHYAGNEVYFFFWRQWRAVKIGRELLGEEE